MHSVEKLCLWMMSALALLLVLSGCTTSTPEPGGITKANLSIDLYEETVRLSDGRKIMCLTLSNGYRGGLSCDWEAQKGD